jgi:purine nucleosidase
MRPIILDTDIGSDVDDLLALTLVAQARELTLLGVSTVYGNTTLRAKIVRAALDRLDLPDIPVFAGEGLPLSGREIFWAGFEAEGIPEIELIDVDPTKSATDFLLESARKHRGELEILAIGPLTNLAKAIAQSDDFVKQVKAIYIMGGAFWTEQVEHNILCDVVAAERVFAAGIPLTAVGLDLTLRVWFNELDLRKVVQANPKIGGLIDQQVRSWWSYRRINQNHPHDPLAALAMVSPELFRFEMCEVIIDRSCIPAGRTLVTNEGQGRKRIASDILVRTAEKEIVRRLTG